MYVIDILYYTVVDDSWGIGKDICKYNDRNGFSILLTAEAMTSGGLHGTLLSTNTNDCAGDDASIMFPNPPFVIAFITNRILFFIIVSRFQFIMETFNNMNH
jgi:hypothetical protein